ncbi:ATP-binding protein [Streptomyces sp. XD-27]|uniref:ATP-binding protein n=1 Tax=Streptomyces sp. XD-27 TaxID=3062779 RepID=UPI0026F476C8|nr:ATP-binding protein [Streptomyces sp. XD-27]WKX73137.1 ATP-binding protein [Streptomyces sp. XD-27]
MTAGEGERGLTLRLARAELSAVAQARRELRAVLRCWGGPGKADVAELLLSELVTNALVHTDRGAVVSATFDSGAGPWIRSRLRVEVRDFVARPPTPRDLSDGSDEATSGRGLLLVHALADAWGVRTHGVGKAVWFELDGAAV